MGLRKNKLRDSHSEVDAGPLNDILFILLMFFLMISTLANPNVIKVNNPKGSKDTKAKQNIVVSIDKDQNVTGSCISEATDVHDRGFAGAVIRDINALRLFQDIGHAGGVRGFNVFLRNDRDIAG